MYSPPKKNPFRRTGRGKKATKKHTHMPKCAPSRSEKLYGKVKNTCPAPPSKKAGGHMTY